MNRDLPSLSWSWAGAGLTPASGTALGSIPRWASWGTPVGGTGTGAAPQMCQGRGLGAGRPSGTLGRGFRIHFPPSSGLCCLPFDMPAGMGAPHSKGMGTAVPGLVLSHARDRAGFGPSPSHAGWEGIPLPRRGSRKWSRWLQLETLALLCSEFSCCQRGIDPRALAGKGDVPSTMSLPCPQTAAGAAYSCRDFEVPASPCAPSLLPWGAMEELGWVPQVLLPVLWAGFGHLQHPPQCTGGSGQVGFTLLHQPSVCAFFLVRAKPTLRALLWGWVPCWWEGGCLVQCVLRWSLFGSLGCEHPEDAAIGEPHSKSPCE